MSKFLFPGIISQPTYDPITLNYISRMTTKPSVEHIKLINDFVLTTKNIINKADVIYLCNINNSNDSFVNLVKNAHNGTIQGSGLVFDPYWGFSNPAGTGYVDTNYNPATQGVNYTLNDVGIGIYNTTVPNYPSRIMGCEDGALNRIVMSIPTQGIKYRLITINSKSTVFFNRNEIPFNIGLHFGNRTASNDVNQINQNLPTTREADSSDTIPSVNIVLFRFIVGDLYPYLGGLNFTYIGASLTDEEYTQLNNAVNDYLIQCLFLKYGHDNWGVKMAKSYFLELHNFEKYEAWEVYEFIKRHQPDATDNYYYTTFGINGQNKTVADYLMLFKAGGNLIANAWTKTGAILRWNQDGSITSSNTMPSYTRGTNLGIVTVTSTDGWNGLTLLQCNQTSQQVNSFYGNFVDITKLKTDGTKLTLTAHTNRLKHKTSVGMSAILRGYSVYATYPGYNKFNISHFIGGYYDQQFYVLATSSLTGNWFEGDVTQITSEFNAINVYINNQTNQQDYFYGSLRNMIIGDNIITLIIPYNGITEGLSMWNNNLQRFILTGCRLNTAAVDAQLSVINNYFYTVTPIKNVTIDLSGANMGIPTGGANNTDLLGIIAKHTAAGYTATIIVRTS